MDLLSFDPTVLAQQLTVLWSQRFCRLDPSVLWSRRVLAASGIVPAARPNTDELQHLVDLSKCLRAWAIKLILGWEDVTHRAYVIAYISACANACMSLNNLETADTLFGALNDRAIARLDNTWALIPGGRFSTSLPNAQSFTVKFTLPGIPSINYLLSSSFQDYTQLSQCIRFFQASVYSFGDQNTIAKIWEVLTAVNVTEDFYALSLLREPQSLGPSVTSPFAVSPVAAGSPFTTSPTSLGSQTLSSAMSVGHSPFASALFLDTWTSHTPSGVDAWNTGGFASVGAATAVGSDAAAPPASSILSSSRRPPASRMSPRKPPFAGATNPPFHFP